ncbi:hypothetical protein [Umezawaea sp. Da 62-37]|nr:hypothetical protein [Umezawaea sp. Da 62-37]WNV90720.1 hypothetical protein RM788_21290 [Umezawaea sp. Da 62-37]
MRLPVHDETQWPQPFPPPAVDLDPAAGGAVERTRGSTGPMAPVDRGRRS